MKPFRPPKDNLYRSVAEVRSDGEDKPVLTGHFSVFNRWTDIDSHWEGTFQERIAPGAFTKSFGETTPKVLLNHGADPELADRPLGRVNVLREDDEGAYYEVGLYRGIPDLVMDGLRDNAYGASFRFRVIKEETEDDPEPSDDNPRGLPRRTITEAQVMEFGPVTFPAYPEATAGVRSLTDEVFVAKLDAASDLEAVFAEWAERNYARALEVVDEIRAKTEEPPEGTPTDEPQHSTEEPRPSTPDRGAAPKQKRSYYELPETERFYLP